MATPSWPPPRTRTDSPSAANAASPDPATAPAAASRFGGAGLELAAPRVLPPAAALRPLPPPAPAPPRRVPSAAVSPARASSAAACDRGCAARPRRAGCSIAARSIRSRPRACTSRSLRPTSSWAERCAHRGTRSRRSSAAVSSKKRHSLVTPSPGSTGRNRFRPRAAASRSSSIWVAMPTWHVSDWQPRQIVQPRATIDMVPNPTRFAPSSISFSTSAAVRTPPSAHSSTDPRRPASESAPWASVRPRSEGRPAWRSAWRRAAPVPPS